MSVENQVFQVLFNFKLKELKKEGLLGLDIRDLEMVFSYLAQKKKKNHRISEFVDLVIQTSSDDVVKYLSLLSSQNYQGFDVPDVLKILEENRKYEN